MPYKDPKKSRANAARQYKDPNNDYGPRKCLKDAIKRATSFGCWIDTSPEDVKKQMDIYRTVHRMNRQPGMKGKWSVDHVMELRNGGPHSSTNMQIITHSANASKSMKQRYAEGKGPKS
jgi:hypothetical protein